MQVSHKLLLGTSALSLAVFGLIALFCPVGMMNWIGFGNSSDMAIIEFMSFYGGLELGLALLFLLPNKLFGLKEKLLCVLFIFASVGLTRLLAMPPNQIDVIYLGIAVFELMLAIAALVLLFRLKDPAPDIEANSNQY